MPPKVYNQTFLESYSKSFPCIIKCNKSQHYAFCNVCGLDFKIAHGGKSDINDHIRTKRHKDLAECVNKNENISKYFASGSDDDVIRAEVYFTSFIVEHNLPISVADHAGPLFRKMFPKSDVAKKYGAGRTKTAAIISKIADVKKASIVESLQKQMFAVATDGSNDTDAQLYPIVVSYFDANAGEVKVSLLAVPTLDLSSTGQNIGNLVLKTLKLKNIPLENCLALSCDNAPVMVGSKNGVAAVIKTANPEIFVVGCPCHLVHIAAERGAAALPISVSDVLVDIFFYLEKSSKKKLELKALQILHDVDTHKILKHTCTRWLSLGRCLMRLLEQWDPLCSFYKDQINRKSKCHSLNDYSIPLKISANDNKVENAHIKKKRPLEIEKSVKKLKVGNFSNSSLKTSEQKSEMGNPAKKLKAGNCSKNSSPKSSKQESVLTREEQMLLFLSSDICKAYCLFLNYIIPVFERSLITLQSNEPKIHILNSLLLDLLKDFVSKFIRADIIKGSSLMDINLVSEKNHKLDDDIIIGSAASKLISVLKMEDKQLFYSNIKNYYIAVCNYIRQKFPLNSEFLLSAEVADVDKLPSKRFKDVDFFLKKFPSMWINDNVEETEDMKRDKLLEEFSDLQITDLPSVIKQETRMDKKWDAISKITSNDGCFKKYSRIAKIMVAILSIPHSNAECERVFSIVKKNRTQFRNSLSDKSLEDILIAKTTQTGCCYEQTFDKGFLKAAKSATYELFKAIIVFN
nr:uncharacterized protein LOC122270094 [Parasteatoda tepidariorum]